MNACLLSLAALLGAESGATDWSTVYAPTDSYITVIRGQSPDQPMLGDPYSQPFQVDPNAAPMGNGFLPPLDQSQPTYVTPPINQGAMPYGMPAPMGPGGTPGYGVFGTQPYRDGWFSQYDAAYLPSSSTENGLGNLEIFEFDAEWRYTSPPAGPNVFSHSPQFGLRLWDGPSSSPASPGTALPGQGFRFGWDFELATHVNPQWTFEFGFTPFIGTDFNDNLTSDAWFFDGRIIGYYRPSPDLMLVLGAAYWNRVDDFVIPVAGVVWNPNSRWEWRLLFPEARVSYVLGPFLNEIASLYATAEYHVEAYQVGLEPVGGREQVQFEDYRALIGLRFDASWYSKFFEAGWVFDREVEYAHGTPGFDVDSGFICRAGFRY